MRTLSVDMEAAQVARVSSPVYQILVYDIRSTRDDATPTTIGDIVLGNTLPAIVGPRDFTGEVVRLGFSERGNDFAQGSISGDSLQLVIQDQGLTFDPVGGSASRWLRAGNVVRVIQGDANVDSADWVYRFTGTLVGRAGAGPRDRSNNATLSLVAESREASLLKIATTSESFPQSYDYRSMMESILQLNANLDSAEYDLGSIGLQVTSQRITQFVDESPLLSLAKIMFVDGFTPRFDGEGKLGIRLADISKGPDVVYTDMDLFESFTRPPSALDDANEVIVLGLDSDMTKVVQPTQVLARASITLGFFGGDAQIDLRWSDDGTQQADNARLNVISSVTGALIPFGSESFSPNVDGDGGSRSGRLTVGGAFYAPLVVSLFGSRIAASAIPDSWAGFGGGSTIPVGRLVEGSVSVSISTILATIGHGQYEIIGEPYEMVFRELRGEARVANVAAVDRRAIEIENHLLDTQTEVDAIALRELRRARKIGQLWSVVMRQDLRLEPEDKFRLPDGREFVIMEIAQTVDAQNAQLATLKVFETTAGVNP